MYVQSPYAWYYEKKRQEEKRQKRKERKAARKKKREMLMAMKEGNEGEKAQNLQQEEPLTIIATEQTYPQKSTVKVIRQSGNDLTCGMRSLQNMYGQHIVTREEMDAKAEELQQNSFGVEMYNKKLGFYHIEVLKAILTDKGKYVQRIDHISIPCKYFHSVLSLNTRFTGYIVTLRLDEVNHYVAIRCNGKHIRLLDSLPGKEPIEIPPNELFYRNGDELFCCESDQRPILAILAVGGTSFVGYTLLHDTWSDTDSRPTPMQYVNAIVSTLAMSKKHNSERPHREKYSYERLKRYLREKISRQVSVLVKFDDKQTLVQCANIQQLIDRLVEMQWLQLNQDFEIHQNGNQCKTQDDIPIDIDSKGSFQKYGIDPLESISLIDGQRSVSPNQAQVGGFYRFDCSVAGTCIGTQHNSYSVRDVDGKVQVVYKKSIERIEKIKK